MDRSVTRNPEDPDWLRNKMKVLYDKIIRGPRPESAT